MTESSTITKNAKSNLAFTLIDLPVEKRKHMAQLYAFCRIVDDIVDEPGMSPQERHSALDRWEQILHRSVDPLVGLEQEVHDLLCELQLDIEPLMELIDGCRSDINQQQPQTIKGLLEYSYKVASCVGISSATVMGASPAAREYAIALGYALQLVNILRDVSEDYKKYKRFYLPADEMALFGVTREDIIEGHYSYRLRELLNYVACLAEKFFGEADEYYNQLNAEDRAALVPAQAMALIYHNILDKMRVDEFRIFEKRYRVNSFVKLWHLLRARLSNVNLPAFPSIAEWGFLKSESKPESKPEGKPEGKA